MAEDQNEDESTLGPDIAKEYAKTEDPNTRAILLVAKALHELGNAAVMVSNSVVHIADATDKFSEGLASAIEEAGETLSEALAEPLKSVTTRASSYLAELLKKATKANGENPDEPS